MSRDYATTPLDHFIHDALLHLNEYGADLARCDPETMAEYIANSTWNLHKDDAIEELRLQVTEAIRKVIIYKLTPPDPEDD